MLWALLDLGVSLLTALAPIYIQLGMITDGVKHYEVFTSGFV
jgi:hypothetical protein